MTGDKARVILAAAIGVNAYEGPVPEDAETAIMDAKELVALASTAWSQYTRGPAVEEVLRTAYPSWSPEKPLPQNGASEAAEEPLPQIDPIDDEPESAPDEDPGTQGDDSDISMPDEEPDEGDTPQESAAPGEIDLRSVPPWEGYPADKVYEILKALSTAARKDDDDSLRKLFVHVWAFETAHKSRPSVLSKLQELGELRFGGTQEAAPAEEPEADTEVADATAKEEVAEESAAEETEVQEGEEVEIDEDQAVETELPHEEPTPATQPAPTPPQSGPAQVPEHALEYKSMAEAVDDELASERLTIPQAPYEDIPELPWDLTKVSDGQLQQLFWVYSQLGYFKNFHVQREERLAARCKEAADELYRDLLAAWPKLDEEGKHKTVTIIEAEIKTDDNVKRWFRRHHKHAAYAASARNERDGYYRLCDSLSRIWTMRTEEAMKAGGLQKRR